MHLVLTIFSTTFSNRIHPLLAISYNSTNLYTHNMHIAKIQERLWVYASNTCRHALHMCYFIFIVNLFFFELVELSFDVAAFTKNLRLYAQKCFHMRWYSRTQKCVAWCWNEETSLCASTIVLVIVSFRFIWAAIRFWHPCIAYMQSDIYMVYHV